MFSAIVVFLVFFKQRWLTYFVLFCSLVSMIVYQRPTSVYVKNEEFMQSVLKVI